MDFCALVRETSDTRHLESLGVEVRRGDLTDFASLAEALDGCGGVIHLAAAADVSDPKLNHLTNVEGVANLIMACEAAIATRVVFVSSNCAIRKYRDAYGMTKREGEKLFEASSLEVTVLRPTMIYGSGSKEFATFVNAVRRLPLVPLIGPGIYHIQPSFVGDAVPAILAAFERPAAVSKFYDIAGPESVTLNDFTQKVADALGRRARVLHLPSSICLLAARGMGAVLKHPPITVDQVMAFLQDTEADIAPARNELGFLPRGLEEGLRLALEVGGG